MKLNLDESNPTSVQVQALLAILKDLPASVQGLILSLKYNMIESILVEQLMNTVSGLPGSIYDIHLHLRGNNIGFNGLRSLFESLNKFPKSILMINLNLEQCQITELPDMEFNPKELQPIAYPPQLSEFILDLCYNKIGGYLV